MIGASHRLTLLQESQFLLNVLMTTECQMPLVPLSIILLYVFSLFVAMVVVLLLMCWWLVICCCCCYCCCCCCSCCCCSCCYLRILNSTPIRQTITIEFM